MSKDIEIEIQVAVENIRPLLEFLEKQAKFIGKSRQLDEYFSPPNPSFIEVRPVVEWLRLRTDGDKQSLNYKHWHHDGKGNAPYCDEYETEVADAESIRQIFKALGYIDVVRVDKKRSIWHYANYEISVDSVKGLGDFVEVEYSGQASPNEARALVNEMKAFLTGLGCGRMTENEGGYAFQLLRSKDGG